MNISHVAIHEIEKRQGQIGAVLNLFEETVDVSNSKIANLIIELNLRYRKPE